MYSTSSKLWIFRVFALSLLLLLIAGKEGYGQRVYADVQQSDNGLLGGSITNAPNAVDGDYNNFSTLQVGIGALGLMYTVQNLQFSGLNYPKPKSTSPIMLKYGGNSSLLGLVDGFSIQRTNNINISSPNVNNTVGTAYSGAALLDLLHLLGDNGPVEVILPVPAAAVSYDGIRLRITTLLGAGLSARLYYAFYITPPEFLQNSITLCSGESGSVAISNFFPGYIYRLYPSETGGTEVGQSTTTSTLTIPAGLAAGEYWLEAREGDLYPSARTKITVVRNNVTGGSISANQIICEGTAPAQLSQNSASTGSGTLSYQWQSKPADGSYSDISSATNIDYTPTAITSTTSFRRATTSVVNGISCIAFSNEITITVNPLPSVTINSAISACQGQSIAVLAFNNVTNNATLYNIVWNGTPVGFSNQYDQPLSGNSIEIGIPSNAAISTYTAVLKVKNAVTGCESLGSAFTLTVYPKPGSPHLIISDN